MNELVLETWHVFSRLRRSCVFVAALTMNLVFAAVDDGHVLYKTHNGETVHSLVADYLEGKGAQAELIHINGLTHPEQVIAGTTVKLPRKHLKYKPSVAKVTRLNCSTALRTDIDPPTSLKIGTLLNEGAVVRIPSACQVVLTLEDDSSLRLVSGAMLRLNILRQRVLETSAAVQVELLDGRVAVNVPRKRSAGNEQLEIRTPTSIAGVRGTEFRVAFDLADRQSWVEVLTGTVGARGEGEKQEQKVTGGYGVSISAEGQSRPIEQLLAPPRYDESSVLRSGGSQQIVFKANPQARSFELTTAHDVLFMDVLQDPVRLAEPVFAASGLTTRATFVRLGAVSASGLMGELADYGLCQGGKVQEIWRCDLMFNLLNLSRPHLHLERVTAQDSGPAESQVLVDSQVDVLKEPILLFRNLPVGHYRWRIDHQVDEEHTARMAGMFQLIAVRSPD